MFNYNLLGSAALALACGGVVMTTAEETALYHHHDHDHPGHGRPDGRAPIGVMGDHMHGQGGWMFSYRFMHMSMDGLRVGTDSVDPDDVLQGPDGPGYMAVPTDMDMQMHMLGAMYGVTDWLTLTAMVNYLDISMTSKMRMPMMGMMGATMFMEAEFETESSGFGDTLIGGLIRLYEDDRHHVHANLGVSLPTGSIDEKDETPMSGGEEVQLPYPMQLGSGTVDVIPGATYTGFSEGFSWGGQVLATLRLGENDNDYTLGNRFQMNAWGAWKANEYLSTSLRLRYEDWGDIDGSDSELGIMPAMNPNADPELRGGSRLDLGIGGNLLVPEGSLEGTRMALELLLPVHQDLDGPQLETDWSLIAGLSYQF